MHEKTLGLRRLPTNLILRACLAGLAGFVVFVNSLHGELIFDDTYAVVRNRYADVDLANLP